MSNYKPHLFYGTAEKYKYYPNKGGPGSSVILPKDRAQHGTNLLTQLNDSLIEISEVGSYKAKDTRITSRPLASPNGIFLSVVSDVGADLDINTFDNKSFRLKTLRFEEGRQILTFYSSGDRKDLLRKKIIEFIEKNTKLNNPRNLSMLNNISLIRPSTLEDLWNDDLALIPTNENMSVECEVWIAFNDDEIKEQFISRAENPEDELISSSYLSLPTVNVFKVDATRSQLIELIALYPDIVEFRLSSENPSVFTEMDSISQIEFTEDLNQRISLNLKEDEVFVTILDTGVNYNNRLLNKVCKQEYCTSWRSDWSDYTDTYMSSFNVYHGSHQAGISAFGTRLIEDIISTQPIEVTHQIESARIMPPPPSLNKKELYGAVTIDTINNLAIDRPYAKRVYSLAVTAEACDGYPTSWSAAIDNFCYECSNRSSDVFIISTGNATTFQKDYWTNARSTKIQDPAQAWNAITVGSCTKLYNISDIPNPVVCSSIEDINPTTSSSHDWEWSDAPIKPEILCEGGNRIIRDDGQLDFHEDLSVLTASGKVQGNVFGSHTDSSAATAEASYIAAKIITAYPTAQPETIRGLIIHSSEWSKPIYDKLEELAESHTTNNVTQEYKKQILKVCGYGIPDLEKAANSQNDRLTLIIESSIKPFEHEKDCKLNEFNLHDLPWPQKVLSELPPNANVKMIVTLSYFIEPNPRVSKIKSKYVYRSHGLSFHLCKPGQDKQDFIDSINRKDERREDYIEHDFPHGWFLGRNLQKSGSIHKDYWEGTAADLSEVSKIVVKPVTGWWKLNKDKERCAKTVNYSLIVTLEVDDNEVDIYTEVANKIGVAVPVTIEV
ncbi:S8 family peptidase [Psychrobacter sp. ANT_H3]|uniref:S8 family peptidase n=1 Tax=Psychrobacter sp. ANT_H3 TaxID=3019444 RepID=UPI0022F19906|nr:S8 family peptidase [Psychrobacter sp. ANT_H3]MDA5133459.1 S8 family peptidase [Psychrobacter sp. ANT_H3]